MITAPLRATHFAFAASVSETDDGEVFVGCNAKKKEQKPLHWSDVMADEKELKKVNHLYTSHYMRAAYGLLGAIGNELHNEASVATRRELKRCIARISKEDTNPHKSEAKCVLHAYHMLDREKAGVEWVGAFGMRRMKRHAVRQSKLAKYGPDRFKTAKVINFSNQQYVKFRQRVAKHRVHINMRSQYAKNVREKQSQSNINNLGSTTLTNEKSTNSRRRKPVSDISAARSEFLFKSNEATPSISGTSTADLVEDEENLQPASTSQSQPASQDFSNHASRLVGSAEKQKEEETVEVHKMKSMPELVSLDVAKSPVVTLANMATELLKGERSKKTSWGDTYEKIKELDYQLKETRKIEDQNRALDAVLEKRSGAYSLANTDRQENIADENIGPLKGVQDVNAFINSLHPSQSDTYDFLSPKLAPLMPPEITPKKPLLSPTLFSFYKDEGNPNNIASIPDLLNATGVKSNDRDALMGLIMEASGAREQVEQTLRGVSGLADWQDVAEAMINANLRMNSTWMKLLSSLTKSQKFELDTKGFTFSAHDQVRDMFFKEDSYYNGTWQNDIPLEEYKSYDDVDRKHLLRRMVGTMARDDSTETLAAMRSWPKRMKQRILKPFAFVAQILVPSVFGYTILSPNIFVANILSPVVFNLELLTPRVFFPIILGPRLLSPRILGPRVFVPQILVPLVFTPPIVRPIVLSPYILAPFVMSPAILAPSALGGRVLSPAVLNPIILSPGALNVDILSPTLLSRRRRKRWSRKNWSR
uniref:Uncharacterized protein n=1 Tax=Plectus sambesii TaxID=2011161 RepID=A0A914VIW4_9BILA